MTHLIVQHTLLALTLWLPSGPLGPVADEDARPEATGPLAQGDRDTLTWDDGSNNALSWEIYSPFATTFTAPYDARLIAYEVYWVGPAGQDVLVTFHLYPDDGGGPPLQPSGSSRVNLSQLIPAEFTGWLTVDLSQEEIRFQRGEIFHPGWAYNTETEATHFGTGLDQPTAQSGSATCWYSGESGEWINASADWVHMVRVVVEKLP